MTGIMESRPSIYAASDMELLMMENWCACQLAVKWREKGIFDVTPPLPSSLTS